jgi:3-polyprenyl-4-hydroxybenzoate decarboxylase
MTSAQGQIVTLGLRGARGAILAQRPLELLVGDARVYLVVTETGQRLFAQELGIPSGDLLQSASRILGHPSEKIEILPNRDDDFVTQYVGRALKQIELPQEKMYCWTGTQQSSRGAKA